MTTPEDFGRYRNDPPGENPYTSASQPSEDANTHAPEGRPEAATDTGPQHTVRDEEIRSSAEDDHSPRLARPAPGHQPPPLPNSGPHQGYEPLPTGPNRAYRPPNPPIPPPHFSPPEPPRQNNAAVPLQPPFQPLHDPFEETTVFPTVTRGFQWQASPPPAPQPQPDQQPPAVPVGNSQSLFGPDDAFGDARQDTIEPPTRPVAQKGWRKAVRLMSAGLIKPGPGVKEETAEQRLEKIRTPIVGVHKVAVTSVKGGVGKTTTTVALGSAIARIRGDRVIAVDLDADLGDLADRFHDPGGPMANIEHLAQLKQIERYADVRAHTLQNVDRLEALPSQSDPNSSYVLSGKDYQTAIGILETHYNVVLCDCGTSVTTPLFSTVAADVGGLVIVAAQNMPGVRGARNTLAWLQAHGFGQLLTRTVVVLNTPYPGSPLVDPDVYGRYFRERGAQVVNVPYDPHLADGSAIEFTSLKKATSEAFLELAGYIADHYPARQPGQHGGTTPGSF